MTRKHFEAIARAVRDWYVTNDLDVSLRQGRELANALADELEQFNPSFDRERFVDTCTAED